MRPASTTSRAPRCTQIYCVDPTQVPGFDRVETPLGDTNTLTCPAGTRILNGGSENGYANTSYPNLNTWTTADNGPWNQGGAFARIWCVSAGAPSVAIAGAPPTWTKQQHAQFSFVGGDPAGFPNSFRCSVDGSAPTSCPSSHQVGPLGTGPHHLSVYNQTADGRTSPVATHHWTVDATPPTVTAPTIDPVSLGSPAEVTWTAADQHSGIWDYEAGYWLTAADGTTAGWVRPLGWRDLDWPAVRLPALAAGETICVSVRARDSVLNSSPWTEPRCTSRPFDDRSLTAGVGWTRGSGAPYWKKTITTTTGARRTLSRSGVQLDRVGVLVTRCPACGIVDVFIDDVKIRRINLERASTTHKDVVFLPSFAPRTGTVKITSVTSDKSVRIDGLITVRTTDTVPLT